MRKLICLLSLLLAFGFSSCSKSDDEESVTPVISVSELEGVWECTLCDKVYHDSGELISILSPYIMIQFRNNGSCTYYNVAYADENATYKMSNGYLTINYLDSMGQVVETYKIKEYKENQMLLTRETTYGNRQADLIFYFNKIRYMQ